MITVLAADCRARPIGYRALTIPSAALSPLAHAPAETELAHEGFEFVGWNVERDAAGNYIAVAKYNVVAPPAPAKTVSYLDPQAANPLLVSVETDDPSSVKAPADPSHAGLKFVGWQEITDSAGNKVFVPKYEPVCPECPTPDCGNRTTPTPTPTPSWNVVPSSGSATPVRPAALPNTGDNTSYVLPVAVALAGSGAALLGLAARRRRDD